jgi:hypothetical protein
VTADRPSNGCYDIHGRLLSDVDAVRLMLEPAASHVLAQDALRAPEGTYWQVLTVYVGVDHRDNPADPPLIFETLVVTEGIVEHALLWPCLGDALTGHHRAVSLLRTGRLDQVPLVSLWQLPYGWHSDTLSG